MPAPLVLLSGAGLPAWIWDDVRDQISAESRVAEYPRGDARLTDYAAAAVDAANGWDSFGIVAHSLGGVVGSEVVAQTPDRVVGFLGVAAVIPATGGSFLGALPFPQRHVVSLIMRLSGTRPPAKSIRSALCAGIAADQADRIVAEFTPESQRVYRDRVSTRHFPVTRAYVLTERDKEFPEMLQERYAAQLGGPVHRLATAHLPMLEQPNALATVIAGTFGPTQAT
jgi:pimeloyl-ACP methyl ester carboxylesterase